MTSSQTRTSSYHSTSQTQSRSWSRSRSYSYHSTSQTQSRSWSRSPHQSTSQTQSRSWSRSPYSSRSRSRTFDDNDTNGHTTEDESQHDRSDDTEDRKTPVNIYINAEDFGDDCVYDSITGALQRTVTKIKSVSPVR